MYRNYMQRMQKKSTQLKNSLNPDFLRTDGEHCENVKKEEKPGYGEVQDCMLCDKN